MATEQVRKKLKIRIRRKTAIPLAIGIAALAITTVIFILARNTAVVEGTIADPLSIAVFVDKSQSLPSDYVPPDLTDCRVNAVKGISRDERKLRADAASALEEMFRAAGSAGMKLYIESGYRSWKTQQSIYSAVKRDRGEEYAALYVALPGHSEHQTGLAMDITNIGHSDSDHEKQLGTMPEGVWLAENAHLFGFILRYPDGKTDITGYSYEPWHFRYVGIDMATGIYEKGITLDEYMMFEGEKEP